MNWPTLHSLEKKRQDKKYSRGWYKWFAWRPIVIYDNGGSRWYWLCFVERRYHTAWLFEEYEYRERCKGTL